MSDSVAPVSAAELPDACRLLAGMRPLPDRDRAAERYIQLFSSGELDPAGLFVAKAGAAIRGVMVVQTMPGALGLAWLPVVPVCRNRPAIEDALLAAACRWLRERGVKVCQAFAGPDDCTAAVQRGGFRHITQLLDFRCALEATESPSDGLQFERLGPHNRERFRATLLETFAGSRDCPEIAESRTEAELLESYGPDEATSREWFLVERSGAHFGVVLLEACEENICELTYVGIVPLLRGQNLGGELVRFTRSRASKLG